jgi:hypothetical protein
MKFRLLFAPILLISLIWGTNAAATTVLPVPLHRMVNAADVVFHGRVISNEVKIDPATGKVATFTEFEVIELIKGTTGKTHTIKQIGGRLPGSNVHLAVHGVPRFHAGEAYVVFLPKASSLGFSSPIGLSQGKFDIHKADGEASTGNGRPVAALTRSRAHKTPPDTPAAISAEPATVLQAIPGQPTRAYLPDFLQAVRGMTKE